MPHVRWITSLLVLALTLGACASSESSTKNQSSNARSSVSSNKIVVEDLSFPVDGLNAYELINRYNPQWLRKRGQMTFSDPVTIKVYVNQGGSSAGDISYLRSLRVMNISSIEHFNASEAQFRFGLDNTAGAILVNMKGSGN